ncbi:MAG: hypothetical protein ACTSWW_09705, partial [Promethearchaeota archaeon]
MNRNLRYLFAIFFIVAILPLQDLNPSSNATFTAGTSEEDVSILQEFVSSPSDIPEFVAPSSAADFDNTTHHYIFLFPSSIVGNTSVVTNFTNLGGVIENGPWGSVFGFSGVINNSETELGGFMALYPEMTFFEDATVSAQMNTVLDQLQIYPTISAISGFNYQGTPNGAIAVLDSGVDSSHSLINESQLLYWNDLVDNTGSPNDPYGHG